MHFGHTTPDDIDVLWFYNEVKVSEGEDVLGSYFMANGLKKAILEYRSIPVQNEESCSQSGVHMIRRGPVSIPEEYKVYFSKKEMRWSPANLAMKVLDTKVIRYSIGRRGARIGFC